MLHLGGIVVFSIPSLISHPRSFAFFTKNVLEHPSTWVTVFFVALTLYIASHIAQKKYEKFLKNYPQKSVPGINFIIGYFLARIIFIGVYEIWFRGYLLSDSINTLGLGLGILLNIVLYMSLHIANGKEEVIACVPFGILLCGLCIWQEAIWAAIAIHLSLTVSFEFVALKKVKMNNRGGHENIDNGSYGLSR